MDNLTWKIERVAISSLTNWDKNPRKITEDAFNKLKERLTKRGMHDILKTDGKGIVISGNQRLRALKDLGEEWVNIAVPSRDLTEKEIDAIAIESNRSDGTWDDELLNAHFDPDFLFDIGFSEHELVGFEDKATTSKYIGECPHCLKKLKLSNSVRKIEPLND